jgi:predicted lipid-binding transport protein (Tim44 family)
MNSQFGFIDIILLAMFAGFIILRLRNVLGRRSGHSGKSKLIEKYFSRGPGILKDIENNDAIKSGNISEEAKKQFLKGAKVAYEQIVTSFAKGDKKSLKGLLEKNMFARFSEVIDERKNKQIKSETTFIGIKSAKVSEFKKIENIYKVTVNFVSEIITCVKDKNNQIIEGNPDTIKTVNDVWKFSKNMWSQDPTWYLVETSLK